MHSLIIWMAVAAIVVAVIVVGIWCDGRRYPTCPTCLHNLNSKRMRFFGKEAVCSKHGEFSPKNAKPFWRHILAH
jgi:hypothetical protein